MYAMHPEQSISPVFLVFWCHNSVWQVWHHFFKGLACAGFTEGMALTPMWLITGRWQPWRIAGNPTKAPGCTLLIRRIWPTSHNKFSQTGLVFNQSQNRLKCNKTCCATNLRELLNNCQNLQWKNSALCWNNPFHSVIFLANYTNEVTNCIRYIWRTYGDHDGTTQW